MLIWRSNVRSDDHLAAEWQYTGTLGTLRPTSAHWIINHRLTSACTRSNITHPPGTGRCGSDGRKTFCFFSGSECTGTICWYSGSSYRIPVSCLLQPVHLHGASSISDKDLLAYSQSLRSPREHILPFRDGGTVLLFLLALTWEETFWGSRGDSRVRESELRA